MICLGGTVLQTWDIRGASVDAESRKLAPLTRISAHAGPVFSVQFHPSWKNTLASGGRDKQVNVSSHEPCFSVCVNAEEFLYVWSCVSQIWNLDAPSFSKPRNRIQTVDAIGKVSWRSGHQCEVFVIHVCWILGIREEFCAFLNRSSC